MIINGLVIFTCSFPAEISSKIAFHSSTLNIFMKFSEHVSYDVNMF
jgi:hypothetical protein